MWTRWRVATVSWTHAARAPCIATRRTTLPLVRPSSAPDAWLPSRAFSTAHEPLEAALSHAQGDNQLRARRCLTDLSRAVRRARTAKQLTTMWTILSRHEPVVVEAGFLRPVGAPVHPMAETLNGGVSIPVDSLAVRMIPATELLSLTKQGHRQRVMEQAPSFATSPSVLNAMKTEQENEDEASVSANPSTTTSVATIHVPHDHVLLLSERFVARKILWALHRLGCHLEFTQFLEAFETANVLDPSVASTSAHTQATDIKSPSNDDDDEEAMVAELTTLGNNIDALYIASLGRLHAHAKLLHRFELHGRGDLIRYMANRDAFRSLLNACVMERNGGLARRILDQALDGPTLTTFNVKPFTSALHANLRGKIKTMEGLVNAMRVYRRMYHEVGYILAPPEWSMLLNASLYLGQHELAMEVFRAYQTHGIAPFQKRFQQALRTACRNAQYSTAVEMARTWVELEQQQRVSAQEDPYRRDDEAECLNKILWEMLKGKPSQRHVEDVLVLMQSRDFPAGALVVRRVVTHFFTTATDDDGLAPEAVLYRFFELWERVPTTIQRTSFVLHLVLEECEAREWGDQCERVIEYALDKNIELPIASTVKLMDRYAARGHFDDAIQLGELVLQPRLEKLKAEAASATSKTTRWKRHHQQADHQLRGGVPDVFFESLLRSYLFRQRFEDVVRLDNAFQLTARRSDANAALATILRDARAMTY